MTWKSGGGGGNSLSITNFLDDGLAKMGVLENRAGNPKFGIAVRRKTSPPRKS